MNLAKQGDAVSVVGFYQPPDDTKVKADRITIAADRVYGETRETPPTRNTRRRRGGEAEINEESPVREANDIAAEKQN